MNNNLPKGVRFPNMQDPHYPPGSDSRLLLMTTDATLAADLLKMLRETQRITLEDINRGHGTDKLIRNTVSELGEFCDCVSSESGEKPRDLKETSAEEGGDVTICALSLFFARGGTVEQLVGIMERKLPKWEGNVRRSPPKE